MSSTWIVKDPSSDEGTSWSLRVSGEGGEVTTHAHLSAQEARIALYRVMLGVPAIEIERHLAPVASIAADRDGFADAA